MNEQALVFDCEGEPMVGIVTPAQTHDDALADVGVVIIVGGPQYRAGSHRQFVQLARSLSQHGATALRFDTRGMGDSGGAQRNLEQIEADLGAAMAAFQSAQPQLRRIVMWGLCGGASAALSYWRHTHDPRLCGIALVNPWVRSEETLARTHLKHYYLQRLGQRAFWMKLLSGGVAAKAARDLLQNLRLARRRAPGAPAQHATAAAPVDKASLARDKAERSLQLRMAQAWQHFPGPKLLVLSGNDLTAKEFLETTLGDALWTANLARPEVTRFDVAGADHTFSNPQAQQAVEARTLDWLRQSLGTGSAPAR